MPIKAVSTLLLALTLSACAVVPAPPPQPAQPVQPARPSLVWRHEGGTSYEARSPGLGISNRYVSTSGWADVYVYNLRTPNWETGVNDPRFAAHFNSTIEEIRLFGQRGVYSGVKIGRTQDVSIVGQRFRMVNFQYARDGKPLHSTTYLTARNGQLLKYRISIFSESGSAMDAVARQFIEESLRDDPSAIKA